MKNIPAGKPLPPKYKNIIDIGVHRQFTMMERIKILIGYTAVIDVKIFCEHSTGKFEPIISLRTSNELLKKP